MKLIGNTKGFVMAFAKKFTRIIVVEGETYLWYFRDNSLDSEPRRIAIQHHNCKGQLLLIDPFTSPYALAFEIRPSIIREIIQFGLAHGWTPKEKGAPLFLGYSGQ